MSDFELLAACIRSGQVPHDEVIRIMKERPDFAAWYRGRQNKTRDGGAGAAAGQAPETMSGQLGTSLS